MTKKEWYVELKNVVANSDYVEKEGAIAFLEHEIELVSRKRSRSATPTKRQIENESIKETIKNVLATINNPVTISELAKNESLNYSTQKISALVSQLVKSGEVVRTVDKKTAYFALA